LLGERKQWDAPFHLVRTGCNPAGNEIACSIRAGRLGHVEQQLPRISGPLVPRCPQTRAAVMGDVLADRMPLVAMDSAFALFEVDGVAGQVPVPDCMAPRVKVEALLADRGARQDEGVERRLEGISDRVVA